MAHHSEFNWKGISGLPNATLLLVVMVLLTGCGNLLPSTKEETISAWHRFEQAKEAYDKINPGTTRAELKELGFDVVNSPNIEALNYLDVAAKVQAIPAEELDPGLRACLQSRNECQAYVFDMRRLRGKRVGGFWADFLNFRRKTDSTGWRFNALLVLVNDQVTYKLWSGTPNIEIYKEERNPLGPLQGAGGQAANLLPW